MFECDPKASNNATCDEVVDLIGARIATAEELASEGVVDGARMKALTTARVRMSGRAVYQQQQVRAWSLHKFPHGHHM